jgi:preprotein translocase subunit SecG
MKRFTFILFVALALAGLALSFLLQRQAEARIRQNENSLRQQQEDINRESTGNRDSSNSAAQRVQTTSTSGGVTDYTAELAQLRAQAAALRLQQVQLSNQQWNSRISAGIHLLSAGNSNLLEHNQGIGATAGGGPRADNSKLNDARGFTAAIQRYAREHQGVFPSTLDLVTAYLPQPLSSNSPGWANAPVSGTNDFEIVYQGGTNDLGNIPPRRVALLRERQPWLTPDGKWARTYAYADGSAEILASDDNFQSWEAVHVVPPPVSP